MPILNEKPNLVIIAIAALIAGSVLIIVLNSGSMSGGNDAVPVGNNGSSQEFEPSPKFEKRLYELLKTMSPGDKIQVSIWLRVPAGNRQDWTMEEKVKFLDDSGKPVGYG